MKPNRSKPISPATLLRFIEKAEEGFEDDGRVHVDRKIYDMLVRMAKGHMENTPKLERTIAELELKLADAKNDALVIAKDSPSYAQHVYCTEGFTGIHQASLGCIVADSDYAALEKFIQYQPKVVVRDNRIILVSLAEIGLVKIPKGVNELERLEVLSLKGNKISDISPLLRLECLSRLYLANNPVNYRDEDNAAVVAFIEEARRGKVYK